MTTPELPKARNRATLDPIRKGFFISLRFRPTPSWSRPNMKSFILPMGLFASGVFVISACAQSASPFIGRNVAENICDACHQVHAAYPPNPKFPAPSFLDISRMPSTTELSIKVFLRTSHPVMPNIILSDEEVDSVAAYIVSLSRPK
jgi:mono/diheme cytochrome c family protein